mgnify:FL=1
MLLGLVVRLHEITQPIVRFHPTRHYRSAVLARACYYDIAPGIPEWARKVADANRGMQQAGEPPLMEWAACGAYLALGHEDIVIPRVLAILIWLSGAIPVWLIARRLASPTAAALAACLHLFMPYGIIASRNFQPDPLMTVASLWAIYALLRHHDEPTRLRFAVAGLAVGAAGLIKPMSVFITVPVLGMLALIEPLPWKQRIQAGAELLLVSMLAPLLFYGYSATMGSLVQDQMKMRFEPQLISTPFFWNGLGRMISRAETVPLFLVALLGAAIARDRVARWVLAGLFVGWAMFAVAFTYHFPTHDYYHLPYLPVVAVGAALVLARVESFVPSAARVGGATVLCLATIGVGTLQAWPRLHEDNADRFAQVYKDVGELAEHETRVLFLDTEYGFAMMYHAEISGDSWPNVDDLAAEAIDGRAKISAEARFVRDYEDWGPTYFIVTDMRSLRDEKDLQEMLAKRATPVRFTSDYQVYKFHPVDAAR